MPCAVIATALPVEYLAVRAHLSDIQEEVSPQGIIYERGRFAANGQVWEVGIFEAGSGNLQAAIEVTQAIAYFNPQIVLSVGIAAGIKDVNLGDVVAATKIYSYELGRSGEQFQPRPQVELASYSLEQWARAEAGKQDWLERLLTSVSKPNPRVFVAPIASGEKVITSAQSEMFQFLRENYGDAIAVEMEGLGFLSAVRTHPQVSAIVIRGISALIDNKVNADEVLEDIHQVAANHASAFAFQLLAKQSIQNRDFFISYNQADKQWAEWIAWTLEETGYSVATQACDIGIDEDSLLDMQRGVAENQKTILVLSESYTQSLVAAFSNAPPSLERKVIPVRVKECELTGWLASFVYADLVGLPEATAKQTLLDFLSQRGKAQRKPVFPGTAIFQATPENSSGIIEAKAFPDFPDRVDKRMGFNPLYAVEICAPKFGSGYRIGGRLVLTAAHLFTKLGSCKVRSKSTFGEVDAEVVWLLSDVDVALVELPDSLEGCASVQFGRLPIAEPGVIDFMFYGWPNWAFTYSPNQVLRSGGRYIEGSIYLADTSPDGLLILVPQRLPAVHESEVTTQAME